MSRFLKILLTVTTVILLGLLLYFEVGLITTKKYTTAFFDPLEKTNVKILGALTVLLIGVTSRFYLKTRRMKLIVSSFLFTVIFGLTIATLNFLDKSEKTVYRQDLGLKAYYLYLNNDSKDYILEYTWPFGKSTLVGHFERTENTIKLDRNIVKALNLKGVQYEEPIMSLNLEHMKKLK